MIKTTPFVFLLLGMVFMLHGQVVYQISQYQETDCVAVEERQCVFCNGAYYYAYFSNVNENEGYFSQYRDSACLERTQPYSALFTGNCENQSIYSNCTMYLQPIEYGYYTASFSSTSSLKVGTTWFHRDNEYLTMSLTSKTASVKGLLHLIQFTTSTTRFFFESLLSTQIYSTNLGVFNFGTKYTEGDFTFEINRYANKTSIQLPHPEFAVRISPFTNVQITNADEYNIALLHDGIIEIETDSTYDLNGIVLGIADFVEIDSMSVNFPSENSVNINFSVNGNGADDSYPCEESLQIVYCMFSSDVKPHFSISIHEDVKIGTTNSDEMSFSLF